MRVGGISLMLVAVRSRHGNAKQKSGKVEKQSYNGASRKEKSAKRYIVTLRKGNDSSVRTRAVVC